MEGCWITHCEIGTIQSDGIAITHAGELSSGATPSIFGVARSRKRAQSCMPGFALCLSSHRRKSQSWLGNDQ